ncbi:hypothetical protein FB192DRAFT_1339317 [Mucor lusitanicus]|uniref:Uncharacterized protein n=2 Tax=Mucor circinelloides f. lusitanicus TaxID=29924 RepID=A0A162MU45_MUCCL|nr:hypothetical protein FB192DRAFT_1339317 [Mucor lusitanicus]OAD05455.1 hypothetical protein MUCCIDRAFT_109318 [Mucor lusitanicus CBS 277.49]
MFGQASNLFQDYPQMPNHNQAPEDATTKVIDTCLKNTKDVMISVIHKRIKKSQLNDHDCFEKHQKTIQDKYPINAKVMLLDPVRLTKLYHPRWLGPYFIKSYTRTDSYYTLADSTVHLFPRDFVT